MTHRHHPILAVRRVSWQVWGLLAAGLAIAAVWTAVMFR